MSGRFITLEGIEGAGKSTLARALKEYLESQGKSVLLTREPGGTALAERLRQIVLERGSEPVSPLAETLVMFAARALHVSNLIRPALARGTWVVCDRFTDATRAYQGAGRGVDGALIEHLAQAVQADLAADLTLLLDLPVSAGLARARARSGADSDRFEAETLAFFERVRAGYLAVARAAPARVRIIDASQPELLVRSAVIEAVTPLVTR
ncbi:MAG TPA: dTMP kinase [Steroidobacteraceae bacterium]|jgi:dTMP kinase